MPSLGNLQIKTETLLVVARRTADDSSDHQSNPIRDATNAQFVAGRNGGEEKIRTQCLPNEATF